MRLPGDAAAVPRSGTRLIGPRARWPSADAQQDVTYALGSAPPPAEWVGGDRGESGNRGFGLFTRIRHERHYSLPVPSQSRQRRLDVARARASTAESARAERELTCFHPRPRHPRQAASRETCRNSPRSWLTPVPLPVKWH